MFGSAMVEDPNSRDAVDVDMFGVTPDGSLESDDATYHSMYAKYGKQDEGVDVLDASRGVAKNTQGGRERALRPFKE